MSFETYLLYGNDADGFVAEITSVPLSLARAYVDVRKPQVPDVSDGLQAASRTFGWTCGVNYSNTAFGYLR